MRDGRLMRWGFFLFFIVIHSGLCAQTNLFTFYSVGQGLAQSTVTDIYKNPKGLLWVGTGSGLSLWNGQSFRNYKYRYNDPKSISNDVVRHIMPDTSNHCVWVGTEAGLDCFDENGSSRINQFTFPEWSGNDHVPLLVNDSTAWLFITGKGIYKLNTRTRKYTLLRKDAIRFFSTVLPGTDLVCYQNSQNHWVRFHLLSGEVHEELLPDLSPEFFISGILPWKNGFLLTSSIGLWEVDRDGTTFRRVLFSDPVVDAKKDFFRCIASDSSGRIWFSVFGKGLFSCDRQFGLMRPHHWQQNGENIGDRLLTVRQIVTDAYGVIWLGTDGEGLVRYTGNRLFFGPAFLETPVIDSTRWFIRSLLPERGGLWAGTYNAGLKHVDYVSGKIESYTSPLFNTIYCIGRGAGKLLLLGTETGLYAFENGQVVPFTSTTKRDEVSLYKNLLRLRDGRCLVGTNHRLLIVDEKNRTLSDINDSTNNISGMIELPGGNIVFAADYKGISVYSPQLQPLRFIGFTSLGLPEATIITDFITDGQNGLWASSNIGLLHFDASFALREVIDDKKGLPDNMIYGLLQTPDGNLLLSTGNGVCTWDPVAGKSTNYSTADGLRSNECNTRALCFSPDGYAYIGSISGFVRRHYPFDLPPSHTPVCFVENFTINEQTADASPGKLPHDKNSLSFFLRLSDFAFSESATWRYHIDGLEAHDVLVPAGQQFRFSALAPGSYHLHVFETEGQRREVYSLAFTIEQAWWQSTWFRVLFIIAIVLFAGGIVFIINTYRYRARLRRLETLQLVEKIRTRISGDIHDDLGAGLTRIALTGDLVAMQLKTDEGLRKKVSGLAATARDLSMSLKEVVWSVKPEYDNLASMIVYFKAYCGDFFEDTSIDFSFRVEGSVPTHTVSPEFRRTLFLILKEALNNTVKHAQAKKTSVRITFRETTFEMAVSDDGIGLSTAADEATFNSSGLANIRKRAASAGFACTIGANGAQGTRILVSGLIAESTT